MLAVLQNGCHVWFGTDDLQMELNYLYLNVGSKKWF